MGSYVVYTYGGGEALYEAFNAIAAMTGGSDYLTLIKLFCVLALFWVVIEMGVRKTVHWHWFLMFMVMFNIFFVPKKAVTIIDRFNPSATRIVANVPFGLAAPAWLFSTMGDGITGLMETYFTLPNDMKYEKTGMIFGSKLMTSINQARFDDPLLNKNLNTYAKQCIYPKSCNPLTA
ncbi:MAG: conjugal transfer protein TraG N-terminal domain-containing protein [Mariprofundaceae bacterium]|nr:conjugal transfer protein TraG N-terminal domain-containing protein [Mariprofundaceae bacterium]